MKLWKSAPEIYNIKIGIDEDKRVSDIAQTLDILIANHWLQMYWKRVRESYYTLLSKLWIQNRRE